MEWFETADTSNGKPHPRYRSSRGYHLPVTYLWQAAELMLLGGYGHRG